jgi:hypothetical protein
MTIARVQARSPRAEPWDVTELWWIGECPWPSMPVGHATDLPTSQLQTFRCCPDDGPTGVIVDVEVHLPRNPGDPAFTVIVDMDPADMNHLVERHGFSSG